MQVIQLNALSDAKIITPSGKRTTAKKWYEDLKLTDKPAIVFFEWKWVEFAACHFHGIMNLRHFRGLQTAAKFSALFRK